MAASPFGVLLRRLRKRYPTVQDFADDLQIAPSRLSRAMGARGLPFDIVGCLKLAKVTGEPPETVLHAAGKHAVADLLHHFYGTSQPVLSDEQRRLLDAFSRVTNRHAQVSLLAILEAMSDPHLQRRRTPVGSTTVDDHPWGKDHAADRRPVGR